MTLLAQENLFENSKTCHTLLTEGVQTLANNYSYEAYIFGIIALFTILRRRMEGCFR